jgi:hypothetical protein
MRLCYKVTKYSNQEDKTTLLISLTLLTETCVNVEQYGGQSEVLIHLIAVVG